jgi:hypothetical protein
MVQYDEIARRVRCGCDRAQSMLRGEYALF